MKKTLFILSFLFIISHCAHAQFTRNGYPADTLSVSGDTAFFFIVGYAQLGAYEAFPALNESGVDSSTIARFAFRYFLQNESEIRNAHQLIIKQRELTKGYPQANQIVSRFSGKNLIEYGWGEFQSTFGGYWRADSANVERFYLVFPEDTLSFKARDVYRINASGNPAGAKLGTFAATTAESFQTNIYPYAGIGANAPRWVALNRRMYKSIETKWRWTWLGRTFAEAKSFIQNEQQK